jgi:hypothetical protein
MQLVDQTGREAPVDGARPARHRDRALTGGSLRCSSAVSMPSVTKSNVVAPITSGSRS